ncbi:putative type-I PKS [Actinoplanes sp. SE50]|uniref:type I polyketide synthase n=1 Tax=unclassified Actinoplanes TaxID=2626549 RepID=UPI00023EBFAC|nr:MULTISPECIES: type I polyketide synthase [unclassified Actinoplanes]AEV86938.1 putative type-I PKS [Actinoplanes sp. SE50/110]ATO85334.1 putative type-I PKS [Actinoplanes sp. SE50]SLM02745.1 type I polyketide synthase [Actinoplanes sp. SE50/110]
MATSVDQIVDALRKQMRENETLRQQNGSLNAALAAAAEPIAIVSMACRYPGAVTSPDELWKLVADGTDAVSAFPSDRGWPTDVYDPQEGRPGRSVAREGGFLPRATDFDADFFGISPREALTMDPQQRILLECAWEAIENAGVDPRSLRGTPTGVWAGVMYHDYGFGTSDGSIVSGRVAYCLGLEGPAVTVDTACSSSLVALHSAVQALRAGDCTLALAGGVTVMANPDMFVYFSTQRGLARDGRCKSFSARADGTGCSEGAGLLLLERLSDARRNGHPVLAVVRGSAVNSDGASSGLTTPNGRSQQRVIRRAVADAGLTLADIDAVEAHGTGTRLGDPIEAQALLATYGRERAPGGAPLLLGSLKSNLGHTQAAAGVGGIIKMVQALRHEELPISRYADDPTPHVDWTAGAVELLTANRPWPRGERVRRAGVSSFGLSGTNAHVILEEAPDAPAPAPAPASGHWPLALSGTTPEALRAQAAALAERLRAAADLRPADVAYSLATGRTAFACRAVVLATDRAQAVTALDAVAAGEPHPDVLTGTVPAGAPPRAGFLFTGQGSQRHGMGRELYDAFPGFATAYDAVLAELDPHLGRPLRDIGPDLLDTTEYAQPALFAFEVALARLVESCGVRPAVLGGHSIGEISAAHLAGVLPLADACRLVAARGRLIQQLPSGGAMVAVAASEDEVTPLLTADTGIAAVNGPAAVVVSGDAGTVLGIAARFPRTTRLRTSHAFHSPLMDPALPAFQQIATTMSYAVPDTRIVSMTTGRRAEAGVIDTPGHWVRHVREPVRFLDGVRAMAAEGAALLLELGPDAVLSPLAETALPDLVACPASRRDQPEVRTLLAALATAYVTGITVDWAALHAGSDVVRVPLPTYAFQRRRFWSEAQVWPAPEPAALGLAAAAHPLLSALLRLPDGGAVLTGRLTAAAHPWIADHAVHATVLLPGTALVELAVSAGTRLGSPALDELVLAAPLTLSGAEARDLTVTVGPPGPDERRPIRIHSRPAGAEHAPWQLHADGSLGAAHPRIPAADLATWPPVGAEPIDVADAYPRMARRGYDYGPAFQGLRAAWRRGADTFAEVRLPATDDGYGLHPALLDAAMHADILADDGPALLPFSWNRVAVHATGAGTLRVRIRHDDGDAATIALEAADETGQPVLTVGSLVSRPVTALPAGDGHHESLYDIAWRAVTPPAGVTESAEVHVCVTPAGLDVPAAVRAVAGETLHAVQRWLGDAGRRRLVVVTRGAVAVPGDDGVDVCQAPVWGLIRAAQAEHPGRIVLVDADPATSVPDAVGTALAAGEPELALRGPAGYVPRLAPAPAGTGPGWPTTGTVLVTGGTGGLGALVARHLVARHGVGRLLLVSRRGPAAPGADRLHAELTALGAEVTVAACDVADRAALQRLLAEVPDLTGVVHCAGTAENALLEAVTETQLRDGLRAKADAAWHLHELTADRPLTAFVLFSSAGGLVLASGQAAYAAANVFLDALAVHRRAAGLPGTSVAYGLWDVDTGLSAGLAETHRARMRHLGLPPLAAEDGLALLDAALTADRPLSVPIRVDATALRNRTDEVPALLWTLAGRTRRRVVAAEPAAGPAALVARLAALPAAAQERAVLELVRKDAAAVLGHDRPSGIAAERGFLDLGFDSLTALELRNRLNDATGHRLPPTLIFDFPSPGALAAHLHRKLVAPAAAPIPARADLSTANAEDLFAMLDAELGG